VQCVGVYFLSYLTSHVTYHPLRAKTCFFYHCALSRLRFLNSGNIINPEQVRSQTFWVNNRLLYIKVANKSFESVAKSKYLREMVTNQNYIQ
jgi:hypothetical protein